LSTRTRTKRAIRFYVIGSTARDSSQVAGRSFFYNRIYLLVEAVPKKGQVRTYCQLEGSYSCVDITMNYTL
jgi:hypothetical protein